MTTDDIFDLIEQEKRKQAKLWGQIFDDRNTANDWSSYITRYNAKFAENGLTPAERRSALVKIAALAMSAIEAQDRNNGFAKRHYD